MARFKGYNYDQDKLLPIRFDHQILPGSFEYNLSYLVDHELDLSIFEHRYHNEETGRPAYDPAILLKIIILAYARGVSYAMGFKRFTLRGKQKVNGQWNLVALIHNLFKLHRYA